MKVNRATANAIIGSLDPEMQKAVKYVIDHLPDDHWLKAVISHPLFERMVNATGGAVEAWSDEMSPITGALVQEATRVATAFTQQAREDDGGRIASPSPSSSRRGGDISNLSRILDRILSEKDSQLRHELLDDLKNFLIFFDSQAEAKARKNKKKTFAEVLREEV